MVMILQRAMRSAIERPAYARQLQLGLRPIPIHGSRGAATRRNPNGSQRILEFRQMVKATRHGSKADHGRGIQYTNASGVNDKSVLDKIVPGYYHRLNVNTGGVENSTCCDNTATENLMMGKLMVGYLRCGLTIIKWMVSVWLNGPPAKGNGRKHLKECAKSTRIPCSTVKVGTLAK